MSAPYRSTPEFDETTLPAALRSNHSTKAGVWGVIRVLEGQLRLRYAEPPAERVLGAGEHGVCQPEQVHSVEPIGAVRMRVDFYDHAPENP